MLIIALAKTQFLLPGPSLKTLPKSIKKRSQKASMLQCILSTLKKPLPEPPGSPLINLLSVNDIIIEVQKTPIKSIADLKKIVKSIFKKGEKTLLLTIINQNNRRRYLGVKIN